VLFGGADASEVRGDTWEWDGNKWTQVSVAGPGPRTFPAMTYDSLRRRVVLFGGNRVLFGRNLEENKFLDDTWEWDGQRWTQIEVPGPPPRAEAVMAFDRERGRSVLFGGHNSTEKGRNWLGDTWAWDGTRWIPISILGASPRNGAAAAYDSARRKIVLFGGRTTERVSGETWERAGKQWIENPSAATQGRFNCVMAYDEARARMIRFGGRYGGQPLGDTWQYDGRRWKRLRVKGPDARNHTAMVYDQRRHKIILFGGHDGANVFGDTWEWDGAKWLKRDHSRTQKRIENGH
jgi:hypothetical protein